MFPKEQKRMTTIYQMPKVSRRIKVSAPAPLKSKPETSIINCNNSNSNLGNGNHGNCNLGNNKTDEHNGLLPAGSITERKENIVISRKARGSSSRSLKLEKPRPLKSTQQNNTPPEHTDKVTSTDIFKVEDKPEKILSPDSARSTASRLIQEVLHNAPDTPSAVHTDNKNRTKLLSQVSRDSGYEEMGSFSRQGSMLDSLRETGVDDSVFDEVINDVFEADKTGHQPHESQYGEGKDMVVPSVGFRSLSPEELRIIESELACMRDSSGDCDAWLWPDDDQRDTRGTSEVVLIREPISNLTLQEDIQYIEMDMPGGHYTAKGRRRMFRRQKMFKLENAEPTPIMLQYSAEDLLRLGNSCRDHSAPESWSYMTQVLPEVCFQKSWHFDTLHYLEERSYVEELSDYVREPNMDRNNQKQRSGSSGDVSLDSKCDVRVRGGSTIMGRSISFSGPSMTISVEPRTNTRWVPTVTATERQEKCPW